MSESHLWVSITWRGGKKITPPPRSTKEFHKQSVFGLNSMDFRWQDGRWMILGPKNKSLYHVMFIHGCSRSLIIDPLGPDVLVFESSLSPSSLILDFLSLILDC